MYKIEAMDNKKKSSKDKLEDKKHLAKILYVDLKLSQTEIAERIGSNQPQISRWVMAEGWDALRTANQITPKQLAIDLYRHINKINQHVLEQERIINPSETDQISKLTATIRELDKSQDLATFVQAFEEFLQFMSKNDEALSAALPDYIYSFLTQKAKELS